MTKKPIFALALNVLLPGVGYIYLGAKNRMWIAIPLLPLAIYNIGYICFAFFTDGSYPYSQNLSPFTSTGLVNITVYSWLVFFAISVDTWPVARRLHQAPVGKR